MRRLKMKLDLKHNMWVPDDEEIEIKEED